MLAILPSKSASLQMLRISVVQGTPDCAAQIIATVGGISKQAHVQTGMLRLPRKRRVKGVYSRVTGWKRMCPAKTGPVIFMAVQTTVLLKILLPESGFYVPSFLRNNGEAEPSFFKTLTILRRVRG